MKECCATCRWWKKAGNSGDCFRYPERVATNDSYVCGEYKPKSEEPNLKESK